MMKYKCRVNNLTGIAIWNCRHIVSLVSYKDKYKEDWNNLIDHKADKYLDTFYTKIIGREHFKYAKNLKPHILEWLATNIKDHKGWGSAKGWCVGNIDYRANDGASGFSIFFHRKKDAMAFIRKFSVYKKPIFYCQYFTDVRKRLNLETMKYEEV